MTNTPGPTPAGWYNDPAGSGHLRWWDGSAWTAHLAPQPEPTPVVQPPLAQAPLVQATEARAPEVQAPVVQAPGFVPAPQVAEEVPYVPFQGAWNQTSQTGGYGSSSYGSAGYSSGGDFARPAQWNTVGAWLLAFSQIITILILILFFVTDGSAFGGQSTSSSPNQPLLVATFVVEIALWVLDLLFAAMDRRKLKSFGYVRTASIWWILLVPPVIYLILRGVAVWRETRRGFGPLIAYGVVYVSIVILSILAAVMIPAFLAVHGGAVGSGSTTQFTAGLEKGLDEHGGSYTVSCPAVIPSTVGITFSCSAVEAKSSTNHLLRIQVVTGTDGKPGFKLLSVTPSITN